MRHQATRSGRLLAVGLVALAVLGFAACGGDNGAVRSGGGGSSDGSGGTSPASGGTSAQSYVGLSRRAAIAKAKSEGREWRITREDDETFPATLDYVETRINFEIDDGKVTKATFG